MSSLSKDPEEMSDDELLERIAALDETTVPLAKRARRVLQEDDDS